MYLQRVDSTLVRETCNKLKEGLIWGNEHKRGKMIKYTLDYDGMFASFTTVQPMRQLSLSMQRLKHLEEYSDG